MTELVLGGLIIYFVGLFIGYQWGKSTINKNMHDNKEGEEGSMTDKLSDAWQCQSCGCYFPHIPKALDDDVKRCSKCVQVEILEASLSKMEGFRVLLDEFQQEAQTRRKDYAPEMINTRIIKLKEALAGESDV